MAQTVIVFEPHSQEVAQPEGYSYEGTGKYGVYEIKGYSRPDGKPRRAFLGVYDTMLAALKAHPGSTLDPSCD